MKCMYVRAKDHVPLVNERLATHCVRFISSHLSVATLYRISWDTGMMVKMKGGEVYTSLHEARQKAEAQFSNVPVRSVERWRIDSLHFNIYANPKKRKTTW